MAMSVKALAVVAALREGFARGASLSDVARKVGVTREYVRQICVSQGLHAQYQEAYDSARQIASVARWRQSQMARMPAWAQELWVNLAARGFTVAFAGPFAVRRWIVNGWRVNLVRRAKATYDPNKTGVRYFGFTITPPMRAADFFVCVLPNDRTLVVPTRILPDARNFYLPESLIRSTYRTTVRVEWLDYLDRLDLLATRRAEVR